jgi:UDP-2-acetamido-2,6-beta-L-arabino-hexul-4-ose reductase
VGNSLSIYRLPGVFGKWCRPNYNSVVATFCHNIANGLPVNVRDSAIQLELVYIDDVVSAMIDCIFHEHETGVNFKAVAQQYQISLGDLKSKIEAFRNSRTSLVTENVGTGFTRALYSTYVSYLSKEQFSYSIPSHGDERGVFVEMLKTLDSGQFSFFTAHPGITRGGHYHHSKTEKFLVIKGCALFKFRHVVSDEIYEIKISGDVPRVVETVPGWTHDITNIGKDDVVVMLWANENFDHESPDTYLKPLLLPVLEAFSQ